jgi:hypothetical protein
MRMVMVESVMVLANLHFSSRLCGKPANVNSFLGQATCFDPSAVGDKMQAKFCGLPTIPTLPVAPLRDSASRYLYGNLPRRDQYVGKSRSAR